MSRSREYFEGEGVAVSVTEVTAWREVVGGAGDGEW